MAESRPATEANQGHFSPVWRCRRGGPSLTPHVKNTFSYSFSKADSMSITGGNGTSRILPRALNSGSATLPAQGCFSSTWACAGAPIWRPNVKPRFHAFFNMLIAPKSIPGQNITPCSSIRFRWLCHRGEPELPKKNPKRPLQTRQGLGGGRAVSDVSSLASHN